MSLSEKKQSTDWLDHTFDVARRFLEEEDSSPVTPFVEPEELAASLDLSIGDSGIGERAVFELIGRAMAMTPKSTTTRFWNQLFAGRDVTSTGADMLTSVLNCSMYTYKAAGPSILIENELTRHMLEKVGFREGEGIFCPGGSLSNMAAMIVARNTAQESLRDRGHAGPALVAYTSADGHYSTKKNAGMIGTGRENVRAVPVDDRGRMSAGELASMIAQDVRTGLIPYIVIATAGTTVRGSFDPLGEIAEVCRAHKVWLHVDGAMGGSVLLSSQKELLAGSELADSFTWDAHKMMGVPLLCSCVLFRERNVLLDNFNETADYLFQSDGLDLNPGVKSMQCGRRNDALKLWAAWKHHGDAGYRRDIDHLFTLAQYAGSVIDADENMTLIAPVESVNACFEYKDRSSVEICDRLRKQDLEVVGYATINGRVIIRLACFNPASTTQDVDRFFAHVRLVASQLGCGSNELPRDAASSYV